MSEEYSVGYSEGYQAGWNAAMDATPPAAQRQWVGFDDDEFDYIFARANPHCNELAFARAIEAKVFEKNGATGVTVPDALNPKDENPAYAAGWNDCRAEMLKGMKT